MIPEEVFVEVEEKLYETEKAVLYRIDIDDVWVPRSVHEEYDDGTILVQKWWAEKEGIWEE